MNRLLGIVAVGGLMTGMLLTAGCASTGQKAADADTHDYVSGMMCPKCETVWVTERKGQYSKISRLSHSREMSCPDCDAMAESQLLEDGKVQLHDCRTCKATPTPIEPTEPPKHYNPRKGMQS